MMAGKTVPPVERRWFLSYNSADRELIRGVDRYLATHGIPTFIDRTSLVAGSPWFDEVERALVDAPGVLVFLGPSGLGSVQKRELQFALVRQAQVESAGGSSFRVIPVLFPRFDRRQLPGFAALNTWIEVANPPDAPELLSALGAAHASTGPDIVEPRTRVCPFRALNAFREEDASLYFGRDKEAGKLLDLVRGHPLVAVVGPSGSGKSSLVLSGLLPRLRIERPPRTAWEI